MKSERRPQILACSSVPAMPESYVKNLFLTSLFTAELILSVTDRIDRQTTIW